MSEKTNNVIIRSVRFLYRYGLWNFLQKAVSQNWRPCGMGVLCFLRNGVKMVGQRSFPPTLKSCRVRRMVASAASARIVLTHNWAGGAEAYVKNLLPHNGENKIVFVVRPALTSGVLFVCSHGPHGEAENFAIRSLGAFRGLYKKPCEIVLNDLVRWNGYEKDGLVSVSGMSRLAADIISLKSKLNATMLFLVHDYYAICPNLFLVTRELRYCANEVKCQDCANCLKDNPYVILPVVKDIDIRRWRDVFAELMRESDEVRTFSKDSAQRIQLCFPKISPTIIPHKPIVIFQRKPRVRFDYMTIGVIGKISKIKGSEEVFALAKYIKAKGLPAKVKVLGTIEGHEDEIDVLGRYQPDELPTIIEKSGVNIVFFSSICPETFSYVTQEVMDLGLPIACFNLGAPRDRIAAYQLGAVISKIGEESVWNTLSALYAKTYGKKRKKEANDGDEKKSQRAFS